MVCDMQSVEAAYQAHIVKALHLGNKEQARLLEGIRDRELRQLSHLSPTFVVPGAADSRM